MADIEISSIDCPEQHAERIDDSRIVKLWTVSLSNMQI